MTNHTLTRAAVETGQPSEHQRSSGPSVQLISDAVVANYIHDISARRMGARLRGGRIRGDAGAPAAAPVRPRSLCQ